MYGLLPRQQRSIKMPRNTDMFIGPLHRGETRDDVDNLGTVNHFLKR